MELVIVTGLSGAGKSAAVDALEDIGYFCVDNMPPELIPTFAALILKSKEKRDRVAVVADIRLGASFSSLFNVLGDLENMNIKYKILFIDADNDVIMRRYQETRRKHPLADMFDSPSIAEAIQKEREILLPARQRADYIIDTSQVKSSQFKERVANLFLDDATKAMKVYCISFGFKYGAPKEADLVFDVRFLPNPYYIEELKPQTGNDKGVQDYVMSFPETGIFLDKLTDMIQFLIPNYIKEGKYRLVIAIGCTGGKHRSVTLANKLYERLKAEGHYGIKLYHRDVPREGI